MPNHRAAHKCLSCLALLRPTHWAKNGFVFLPLFFDGALGDKDALLALLAFVPPLLLPARRTSPRDVAAVSRLQAWGIRGCLAAQQKA